MRTGFIIASDSESECGQLVSSESAVKKNQLIAGDNVRKLK